MSWLQGRRFWIALLVVSLGVNGVLAGILAQRTLAPASTAREGGAYVHGSSGFNPRAFVAALPEERREAARSELRAGLRELRPLFGEMIARRREMNALLRAEELDEAAMLALTAEIRALRVQLDAAGEAVILGIVSDLEPEARGAALEAAYSPRGRGMRRGDRTEGERRRHYRGERSE
ncbi:hypothetical protein GCM10007420_15030 [Glycocaulis albus]|jgi:uncharacterized membrane protein|uniref:Periplasmic heavy metal sensor n=1 Tax=Glycocaulis albus TaxID=1382801 RepID=A0ABQ1XQD6_9PROT|nr:periplasmic heavy metal sensor [Glycocaulis albus]MBV5257440.1 periplasmic heavy metal sensor [Synechococcus moorigangaii CMS01]GGH00112.1 hypothetical protein GCM10007420_15030 [Glycocaulis albus]